MDQLSDEVLFHVFSYLNQRQLLAVARVARQWMRICYDSLFWLHIDFSTTFPDSDANTVLDHIASRVDTTRVRSLDLTRCSISLHGVDVIMEHFCNIDDLSLSWCRNRLADPSQGVVWTLHSLTTLVLAGCSYLSDEDAAVVSSCCTQLRHLDLAYCDQKLTDKGVTYFAENCCHLEFLSLDSCTLLTGTGVAAFGVFCTKLQYLNVNSIENLSDQSFIRVVSKNPNLECLHLDFTEHITDASVVSIAKSCVKLRELHLFLCFGVSDVGLSALAKSCNDLQYIGLFGSDGVTDVGSWSIANGCRHLNHLEISANRYITDESLMCVAQCLPQVKHLRFRQCSRITHKGVLTVLENCTKLVTFLIQECQSIGRGMDPRVDDSILAIEDVIKPTSSLLMLNLSMCQHLSDHCLWLISLMSPSLCELDVSMCSLLTDTAVLGIAQHCPKLVSLKLHWCVLLTDDTLRYLAHYCSELRHLTVGSCDEISNSAVNQFRQQVPSCTVSGLRRSESF